MIQLLFLVPTDQLPGLQTDYFAISAAALLDTNMNQSGRISPPQNKAKKNVFVIPGLYKWLKPTTRVCLQAETEPQLCVPADRKWKIIPHTRHQWKRRTGFMLWTNTAVPQTLFSRLSKTVKSINVYIYKSIDYRALTDKAGLDWYSST